MQGLKCPKCNSNYTVLPSGDGLQYDPLTRFQIERRQCVSEECLFHRYSVLINTPIGEQYYRK